MTEDKKMNNISLRTSESIEHTLKNIINEIAEGVSSSDFQQILTHLKEKPSSVKPLYNLQTEDIINNNHQIIDKMCNETGIYEKYNEITQLINDTKTDKNTKAWRPVTGDCNMQLEAYRKKNLIDKKTELEKMLKEERNTRTVLQKSLDQKRSQIETLSNDIHAAKAILVKKMNYNR